MPQTVFFSNSVITAEAGFDKSDRIPCIFDACPVYQRLPVLVLSARDERAIAWLIDKAGFDAVQQACGKIAGNRKHYPSNLAKILGLSIPQSVIDTPVSVARERIRELRALLASKQS